MVVGADLMGKARGVRGRQGRVTRHRGVKRFDRGGWPLQVRGRGGGRMGREKYESPQARYLFRIHLVWDLTGLAGQ